MEARQTWAATSRVLARVGHVAALAGLACALGCSASAERPPVQSGPSPTPLPHAAAGSNGRSLQDADWGWLEASGFGVALAVPERDVWAVIPGEPRWFVARYATSDVTLSVRTWRARRTVTRAECERELFLSRSDLRSGSEGVLLEERALGAPEGFDAWLRVWIDKAGVGHALSTAAGPGRCFAAVFRARGDEQTLAGELRLAADGVFEHVRLVDVEAKHAPPPSLPASSF